MGSGKEGGLENVVSKLVIFLYLITLYVRVSAFDETNMCICQEEVGSVGLKERVTHVKRWRGVFSYLCPIS
jgi:hypothetical protein